MNTSGTDRRGFALAVAMMAIVVIGALIAGAFFASTQEFRIGRNTLVGQRAFAVAEYGLNKEISEWDRSRNVPGGMPTGTVSANHVYVAGDDTAYVTITKLNDNTFWVVSEGQASMSAAQLRSRQRTNAIVRIAYPTVNFQGAVTTAGNVNVTGSARISGNDHSDSTGSVTRNWSQCANIADTSMAGVAVRPGASVSGASRISGSPAIQTTASAGDSTTYIAYGSETWNTLVRNADIRFAANEAANPNPVGTDTTCTLSNQNWGEPNRGSGAILGCKDYFPIIYYDGNLTIQSNGRGQGILLINGDFEVRGTFDFYGIVIVKDDIERGNGTANLYGAVMSRNANLGQGDNDSNWMGNQNVFFSNCAVQSALRGSAILVPVRQRGWAQLFN
jgi:hypothetical protein